MKGLVFNIQRFSLHDGPGIRSTVFLKGCNLKCFWCHNPESISEKPQVQFFSQNCMACGNCEAICPAKAHKIIEGQRIFVRELCNGCGKCTQICYTNALVMSGNPMTVSEVMSEIEKDKLFYLNSGGGITFSGGEPLLQKDFLKELLYESKKKDFHTAIETAGNIPWEFFTQIKPYADLFLYDIKAFDNKTHKAATGFGNSRILENLRKLSTGKVDIWVRIPVIPGVNDNVEEMSNISACLKELKKIKLIELLPFHRMGEGKYNSLGLKYKANGLTPPENEHMNNFIKVLRSSGIPVKLG